MNMWRKLPAKASSRVVLPQPEGPMRAKISPGCAYPLSPSRITTGPFLRFTVTDRSSQVRNTSEMQKSSLRSPATPLAGDAGDGSEVRRGKNMELNWHADQLLHEAATVVLVGFDRSGLVGLGVGAQRGSGDAAIDIYSLVAFVLEAVVTSALYRPVSVYLCWWCVE